MPDWAVQVLTAIVSGLLGAGGFFAYLKNRGDAQLALTANRDDHTLRLRDALDKDEAEFRNAVYAAYLAEVGRNRDLAERLSDVQKQLLTVIGERDDLAQQLRRAQTDLNSAHEKIRHLETEIAVLRAQQQGAVVPAPQEGT